MRNEFDRRNYNTAMILQSLTTNFTATILDAYSHTGSASNSFDVSEWRVILARLTVALRILAFVLMKNFVSRF